MLSTPVPARADYLEIFTGDSFSDRIYTRTVKAAETITVPASVRIDGSGSYAIDHALIPEGEQ